MRICQGILYNSHTCKHFIVEFVAPIIMQAPNNKFVDCYYGSDHLTAQARIHNSPAKDSSSPALHTK